MTGGQRFEKLLSDQEANNLGGRISATKGVKLLKQIVFLSSKNTKNESPRPIAVQ